MKLKTQEDIRMVELALLLGSSLTLELFESEIGGHENIIALMQLPYTADILSSFMTQKMTDEWKELKRLDENIISNTTSIINCIGTNDIIGIFATYVYLYRKGYLSYNKNFIYDNDMKDFASLLSIDVYRGKGVCRSISHSLTNIYKNFGYNARTLLVNANDESIKNNIHLSKVSLQKSKKGGSFAKAVGKLTSIVPIPNHAITLVDDGFNGYRLDPTNDCMVLKGNLNKLLSPCSDKGIMRNYMIMNLLYSSLGFFDNDINILKFAKQCNMPDISVERYKELYLHALEICEQNKDLFEFFYEDNKPLYESINEISKDQRNYIKRLYPLIPNKK